MADHPQTPSRPLGAPTPPVTPRRSPTKAERDLRENMVTQSPGYDACRDITTRTIQYVSSYQNQPVMQTAIVSTMAGVLDGICARLGLDRAVLIPPDVQLANDDDDDDFVVNDNAFAGINTGQVDNPVGAQADGNNPNVPHTINSAHTLAQFGMLQGDGNSEHSPLIAGTHNEDGMDPHRMDLTGIVTADVMTQQRLDFASEITSIVRRIDYMGGSKYVRLHPYTAIAWTNLLFGAIDTSGWKTLTTVCTKAQFSDEHGVNAAAAAGARAAADREPVVALKKFFHAFASAALLSAKKDEFFYLQKAMVDHDLVKYYTDLQRVNNNSAAYRKINASTASGVGVTFATRVKEYVARRLNITPGALDNMLASARPAYLIATGLGMGFLPLVDNRKFTRMNRMVMGLGNFVVPAFCRRMRELTANPVDPSQPNTFDECVSLIYERVVRPIRENNVGLYDHFALDNTGDPGSFSHRVHQQLLAPPAAAPGVVGTQGA